MKSLKIRILPVCEDFGTNGYLVSGDDQHAVIIDPGTDIDALSAGIDDTGWELDAAWVTHGHFDHMGGLRELSKRFSGVEVLCPSGEADHFRRGLLNLSTWHGQTTTAEPPDQLVGDGDTATINNLQADCIGISGHSPLGISYYFRPGDHEQAIGIEINGEEFEAVGVIFSGDILFAGAVGRWDLPGGNQTALISGIKEKLFTLPDNIIVFPGHGGATTIGEEKINFPY